MRISREYVHIIPKSASTQHVYPFGFLCYGHIYHGWSSIAMSIFVMIIHGRAYADTVAPRWQPVKGGRGWPESAMD